MLEDPFDFLKIRARMMKKEHFITDRQTDGQILGLRKNLLEPKKKDMHDLTVLFLGVLISATNANIARMERMVARKNVSKENRRESVKSASISAQSFKFQIIKNVQKKTTQHM